MVKYLRISSYIRKPFLIYDFAPDPIWISIQYMWGKFSFLFYQCIKEITGEENKRLRRHYYLILSLLWKGVWAGRVTPATLFLSWIGWQIFDNEVTVYLFSSSVIFFVSVKLAQKWLELCWIISSRFIVYLIMLRWIVLTLSTTLITVVSTIFSPVPSVAKTWNLKVVSNGTGGGVWVVSVDRP